jgi:hypothetical protein
LLSGSRSAGRTGEGSPYPRDTDDRLVAVKDRYDPTNLFHLNQNIRPSGIRS